MKNLRATLAMLALPLIFMSCQTEEDSISEEHVLKRMPYNEQVFFLDKQNGWSHVYKVEYDFQGLQGDAILTPFVRVPGGSHMTVSPVIEGSDTRYLTIVNNGKPGKVHLVNVNDASDHRVFDLYKFSGSGPTTDAVDNNRVRITQVDYDKNNFLFIAGRDGFFRVSADYSDMDPNVWEEGLNIAPPGDSQDEEPILPDYRFWAVKLSSGGGITMEEEDGEDYFDEPNRSLRKPKFRGGDILFTQNNEETGGFEKERLISVTQAHGNAAILVNLEFASDGKAVSFDATKLFNLMRVTNKNGERGIGKVTGGALVGDNHLITSHHFTTVFEIRSLTGELLASPNLVMKEGVDLSGWNFVEKDGHIKHNWGDMASIQVFDNAFTATSRSIPENVSEGYFPLVSSASLAEVELYRPGSVVLNSYDLADDNPEISKEARRNSSNSDIADLRQKPYKFASLGKENGYMILKFDNMISVSQETILQVVETTWNRPPSFENPSDAFSSYPERASVYVSDHAGRYVGGWIDDDSNWTKVGDAYISSNEFELDGLVNQFKWVKIVDDGSTTPDGFDVNFVATYEAEPEPTCIVEDFCTSYPLPEDINNPVVSNFVNSVVEGENTYFKIRIRNTKEEAVDYSIGFTTFTDSYETISNTIEGKTQCFIHVPVVNINDNPTWELTVDEVLVPGTETANYDPSNIEIACQEG